jgi:hypothetical protein
MQNQNIQLIIIIVGAVAGLLPVLLTSALSWLEKRSLATKQNRALDLAKRHIEFLDSWVKVQETISSSERFEEIKLEASEELDQLRISLSERMVEEEEEQDIESGERNLLQRLFLAYWPHNAAGWVWHTLFYMFLGMTVLWAFAIGIDPDTGQFSMDVFWSDLVLTALLFIFPLLFIRWLAVRTDRIAEGKMAALRESKT